jgi:WD40 repeat protein
MIKRPQNVIRFTEMFPKSSNRYTLRKRLDGHQDAILSLGISKDGSFLASGGEYRSDLLIDQAELKWTVRLGWYSTMVYGNIHYGSHPGAWPISERSAKLLGLGKADQ